MSMENKIGYICSIIWMIFVLFIITPRYKTERVFTQNFVGHFFSNNDDNYCNDLDIVVEITKEDYEKCKDNGCSIKQIYHQYLIEPITKYYSEKNTINICYNNKKIQTRGWFELLK